MNPTSAPADALKRQLAQLDELIAQGALTGAAARKARDDLERRLLQAVLAPHPARDPAAPRPSRRLLGGIAAFVAVVAAAGYAGYGNREGWRAGPGAQAAAAPASVDAGQIAAMVDRLAQRMKERPDDAEGWSMLARSYAAQGRFDLALPAAKRVVELRPNDAQALADYADTMAVVNQRSLEGEPEKLVRRAIELDPTHPKALALAGTIAYNRADYRGAAEMWERAALGSEPGGDFARGLADAAADARQRAGMPAAPPSTAPSTKPAAPAVAAAPARADPAPGDAAAASVSGRVTLKAALKGRVSPDDTVFVFARPPGARMPLAVLRKKVSDLPLDFSLDDSMAMSPAARLSSSPQVVVGARISKSGNAAPSPGDLQVLSAPVALGARGLTLEIGDSVP